MEPSDDARDQEVTPEECKPEVSNTDGCKPKECEPKEHKPEASEPCSFATLDWIQEVFKTIDTPLRTHRITLSYSMFSVCLDNTLFGEGSVVTRTSGGEPISVGNANWFNFATWGTYTLGPNIRNDGAPQRLDSLPNSVRRRMAPAIIQSRSAQGDVVGRALAWGQELIFLSASRALLQFVDMIDKEDEAKLSEQFRIDDRGRAQILKSLNWSGLRFIDEGHLQLVDDAFDCYRLVFHRARALHEIGKKWDEIQSDPDVAKLMFFATCLLTAAEQDVVNRALAVVINSVPERWSQALDGKLSQLAHWRSGVPQQVAAYNLLARLKSAEGILTEAWARLMTKYLLVIVLPTEMLRLGRNVPLRNPTEPMFPLPLMDLDLRAMNDYDPIWQNIADRSSGGREPKVGGASTESEREAAGAPAFCRHARPVPRSVPWFGGKRLAAIRRPHELGRLLVFVADDRTGPVLAAVLDRRHTTDCGRRDATGQRAPRSGRCHAALRSEIGCR